MKLITVFTCLTICCASANAEVAVVVHPANANTLDTTAISRIFLGKMKEFPDGSQAVPVTQLSESAPTAEFNDKVLSKSASQLKAYWSKLVFTGKGTPPKEVESDAAIIDLVSSNPNIIGYVDSSAVTGSVKVIATF